MPEKAQHTPGPWKASGGGIIEREGAVWGGGIALLSKPFSPEGEANARLIAAAPDLLAALREIAETPCDHGPGFCARKIAQAALKQAEGRGA